MDLFAAIDSARARHDVLEHSFYVRWSRGELSREELAVYAGEYRHVVVALSDASARAAELADDGARPELARHAEEEAAHVALWDGFVAGVGGQAAPAPAAETADCADAWSCSDRDLSSTLAVLYAIEAGQPAIAETKLEGLRAFYGIVEGEATEYFEVHAAVDHEHAALERRLLAERVNGGDGERIVAAAEGALAANWRLLDGVERRAGA